MPTFLVIGYGDEAGYHKTTPAARERAHAHDEQLRKDGARMGPAGEPVHIRNTEGREIQVEHGAFMRAGLPVAGFTLLEANTLDQAIDLAADTPCAVAHGVVEVWPLKG